MRGRHEHVACGYKPSQVRRATARAVLFNGEGCGWPAGLFTCGFDCIVAATHSLLNDSPLVRFMPIVGRLGLLGRRTRKGHPAIMLGAGGGPLPWQGHLRREPAPGSIAHLAIAARRALGTPGSSWVGPHGQRGGG